MHYRLFPTLVMAAAVMKLAACGGSTSSSESFVVGPGGGTFTADGVVLTIPSGAVGGPVTITVTDDPAGAPSGFTVDGKVYRFAPEGFTFAAPIAVSFPIHATTVSVYWTLVGSQTAFAPLTTTVDGARAIAQVTHFSSGFVGVTEGTVTCTAIRRNDETCGTITTIETPGFAFVPPPGISLGDPYGALTCDSQGLQDLVNGPFYLLGDADHTDYSFSLFSWSAHASVSDKVITSFTADGARQGGMLGACVNPPPLIEVHCRGGGNGGVDAGAPPPVDSGPTDAGAPGDASPHAPAPLCADAGEPGTCPGVDANTDNNNCGGCGIVCSAVAPSTAQCTAGRCLVTLAVGSNGPEQLALDQTYVYWNGFHGSAPSVIAKVPLGGGPVTTLVSGYQSDDTGQIQQPTSIAIDATGIYWTNQAGPITTGSMKKIGLDGGPVTTLVSGLSGNSGLIECLVVDSANAYWLDNTSAVTSVPLAGGPPVTVDASTILQEPGGYVLKAPLGGGPDGGAPQMLTGGYGVAIDATNVYWALGGVHGSGGRVMKTPIDGGTTTTLATGGEVTGLTVDCASVYWTDSSNGNVMKVSIEGGTTTLLATGVAPFGIKVDATSVYWADVGAVDDGGAVMKLTPK